jgi:hypothetical protein
MVLRTFDEGKGILIKKKKKKKKTTCLHVFPKCFKHIKWLLKHGEFSWKFCSCNFESIRSLYIYIYIYILCSHGDFSNFQKTIFKDCPHTIWFYFFLLSPLVHMWPFPLVIPIVLMTCTSMGCHVLHKICFLYFLKVAFLGWHKVYFLYFMLDFQRMKNNPWSLFKGEPSTSSNF